MCSSMFEFENFLFVNNVVFVKKNLFEFGELIPIILNDKFTVLPFS